MKPSKTEYDDEFDTTLQWPAIRRNPSARKRDHEIKKMTQSKTTAWDSIADNLKDFTYQPSRHESAWLMSSLGEFYDQQWFDDILMMVKGGKEASVYLCKANANVGVPYLAAKVYRPRRFRNLKKDHIYREGRAQVESDGRVILDDGMLHAMSQRTAYGMLLLHESWLGSEYKTLQLLAEAGADIPRPYASGANAILMDYIGDESMAAPTLNSVNLDPAEARVLFERVMFNIELCLKAGRIHADLSAYNILYWDGAITLIDFPQAIHPDENRNAYRIFQRDVLRVCEYFNSQGVHSDPSALAKKLWLSQGRRIVSEIDPHYLDPDKEEDRKVWEKQKRQ